MPWNFLNASPKIFEFFVQELFKLGIRSTLMCTSRLLQCFIAGIVFFVAFPSWGFAATLLPDSSASVSCTAIARDLKTGMTGGDVRLLQQMLNRAVATRVAEAGPGSPGQETDLFGPRTKIAVSKFQELYKETVLFPAGLTKGTGYVGKLTRTQLAVMCSLAVSITPTPVSSPSPSPLSPPPPPILPKMSERLTPAGVGLGGGTSSTVSETGLTTIMYPDNYAVAPGSIVRIYGAQFAPTGNIVHVGNAYTITTSAVGTLGTLDFTLPWDVPLGKQALWITNSKGTSNTSFLIITSPGVQAPVIERVTPTSGKLGNTITLTGSGFASSGNEVRFGDMTLTGLSSPDGKTLVFTATSTVFAGAANRGTTALQIPLHIYVLNTGGISNAQPFTLTF